MAYLFLGLSSHCPLPKVETTPESLHLEQTQGGQSGECQSVRAGGRKKPALPWLEPAHLPREVAVTFLEMCVPLSVHADPEGAGQHGSAWRTVNTQDPRYFTPFCLGTLFPEGTELHFLPKQNADPRTLGL